MNTKRGVIAAVAATAVMLTSAAAAGPAEKQRVAIQSKGAGGFVLAPLSTGALERDSGTVSFCCWSSRVILRDGQRIETGNPTMTLVGGSGTLVTKNRMEFLDIRGGFAVFTGTWTVVRGTDAYAGLSGGGRVAGIVLPNGETRWQREGFVSVR